MKNQKNMKICIRVDENLYADLVIAAQDRGVKVSTLVRELVEANGHVPRPVMESKIAEKILSELSKQGSNLNQLTRKINEKGLDDDNVRETYNLIKAFGIQRYNLIKEISREVAENGICSTKSRNT